jgi:hypothetical protein
MSPAESGQRPLQSTHAVGAIEPPPTNRLHSGLIVASEIAKVRTRIQRAFVNPEITNRSIFNAAQPAALAHAADADQGNDVIHADLGAGRETHKL